MNFILRDGAKQLRLSLDPNSISWFKQNPPAEHCLHTVGGVKIFVKRQALCFQGWGLLVSALSERQLVNSARVLSICHDDIHYYYFSERLEGQTLEQAPQKHTSGMIGMAGALSICDALEDINRRGFWYADLCAKNIFITPDGYRLIDLDSALPHSVPIRAGLPVAYDHKFLLDEFAAKRIPKVPFSICSVGGDCINQAEMISFALDASIGFKIPAIKRKEITHELLNSHKTRHLYQQLFNKLVNNKSDWVLTRRLVKALA